MSTQRRLNGAAVKAIREALGIRGSVFAVRVPVSHGYLVNLEKGVKQPSPAIARKIADELGVPLDAITYPAPVCTACEARTARAQQKAQEKRAAA
jgi:transcriptional regulator with XRE-family HTH domain